MQRALHVAIQSLFPGTLIRYVFICIEDRGLVGLCGSRCL